MVAGMVTRDRELIVSRGPVSPDGVFDIGSITNVFTAVALADMAFRGEVALDDPLERFLPEGVRASTRPPSDFCATCPGRPDLSSRTAAGARRRGRDRLTDTRRIPATSSPGRVWTLVT